jgi:N-acetyl-D-muramate 6-phosphate phosphatase
VKPTAPLSCALFDLDGTLLDTAPDFVWCLNTLREQHQLPPLDYPIIRAQVSNGTMAVLRLGFPHVEASQFEQLRPRFLQLYRDNLTRGTRLFDGFDEVLALLESRHIPWGVVTNKPGWLAEPLLQQMGLFDRAAAVLCGDSLPVAKPDPLPLITAAQRAGVEPARCLYAGDALRDAQAARSANMVSIGARFGYLDPAEDVGHWPVDAWIERPRDLLEWFGLKPKSAGA